MDYKAATALLRTVRSDPNLATVQTGIASTQEQYPTTWDQAVKRLTKTQNSLRNALEILAFNPEVDGHSYSKELYETMVKERQRVIDDNTLTFTQDSHGGTAVEAIAIQVS